MNYSYIANSNKLLSVTEQSLGTTDNQLGDFTDKNTSNDDYSYDDNGNLITDKNKAITAITYNHLNLPQTITITGKGNITYTYDAAGTKLKKVTVDNTVSPSKTTTTYYVAGFVYEQINTDTIALQFFGHEEGRVRKVDSIYVFDYMVKDHLGNVRMVLTDEQKQDIYQATFEDENIEIENNLFTNVINIIDKPECFDEEEAQTKVQEVGAASSSMPMVIGAGKLLKVMAGDHINARVLGWYSQAITHDLEGAGTTPIEELLFNLFSNGLNQTLGVSKADNLLTQGGGVITSSIT